MELRKAKKDDQLMKRRNIDLSELENPTSDGEIDANTSPDINLEVCRQVLLTGQIESAEYLKAVTNIRKLLSRSHNPPVDTVVEAGLVPLFVKALTSPNTEVQFEAAWTLTNIVSGTSEQTFKVIEAGAVAPLVALLYSPNPNVADQAVWALGNIAGESAQTRDLLINAGVVNAMVNLVQQGKHSFEFLRTLAWAFTNFCRHKQPYVLLEQVRPIIPIVVAMVQHEDRQVRTDACWALSYLTDGPDDRISPVLDSGVLGPVINLLSPDDKKLAAPALRTLGNIVTGSDEQTQIVIDSGVLDDKLPFLMASKTTAALEKECCWMVSNILAGTQTQIQSVIQAGIIPLLVEKLTNGEFRTQIEAAWAVTNLVTGGTKEQVAHLLTCQALEPYTKLLSSKDPKLTNVVLDGIQKLFELAAAEDDVDRVCELVEECGALDRIEELQQHSNEDIYKRALHIIQTYFGEDSETDLVEDDKENFKPREVKPETVVPQGGFQF